MIKRHSFTIYESDLKSGFNMDIQDYISLFIKSNLRVNIHDIISINETKGSNSYEITIYWKEI